MTRVLTVTPNPVLDRTMIVPDLRLNEVLFSTATYLDPSGKGFNVSRALLGLGMESRAYGFFGGETGDKLQRMLREAGVDVHAVPVQEETRTNVVIADAAGKLHVKANEAGPNVTPAEVEALLALLESEMQPGDICVMTGSLARGIAPDFYARLIALAKQRGALPVLDTSAEPLRQGVKALPWLLKINDLEAGQALNRAVTTPEDAMTAATELRRLGIDKVAISLGAQGAVGNDGSGACWVQPPSVTALNAVGAGDALMGGMVWALVQQPQLSFEDVLRWGVATATAKVMRANVTYGNFAEVAPWVDQVSIVRQESNVT